MYKVGEESHNLYWKEVMAYKMMGLNPLNDVDNDALEGNISGQIFKIEHQNIMA